MPTTKLSDLRKLAPADLQKRVVDSKKELMELRFQASIGQLDKNHRVREVKREVAQMLTVLGEKARGIEVVSKAEAAAKPTRKPAAKKPSSRAKKAAE